MIDYAEMTNTELNATLEKAERELAKYKHLQDAYKVLL